MPRGFFHKSRFLQTKAPASLIPKCGACGFYKHCQSPKIQPQGDGKQKILIVSESPSKADDTTGQLLSDSNSSRYLERALQRAGIDIHRDCRLTNALICYPKKENVNSNHIRHCWPNLKNEIETYQPRVIITLGLKALQSVLIGQWKKTPDALGPWVGWNIPSQKYNAWICPTHHPSELAVLKKAAQTQTEDLFFAHIEKACDRESRPWKAIPDYKKQITVVSDSFEAAKLIRKWTAKGLPASFDYETNMLKPDSDQAIIVSCAICFNNEFTIAYPWTRKTAEATKEFLMSDCPKIGANIIFEERWTLKEFGTGVNNWIWDGMNNAHICDNRPDITSVKFQSFVRLGFESYDEHIAPLMKARKGQKINQVAKEIDLNQLLLYNGIDALVEYKIARSQMKELKYDPIRSAT
jgi:uracil-DNA glycosylase family 4